MFVNSLFLFVSLLVHLFVPICSRSFVLRTQTLSLPLTPPHPPPPPLTPHTHPPWLEPRAITDSLFFQPGVGEYSLA